MKPDLQDNNRRPPIDRILIGLGLALGCLYIPAHYDTFGFQAFLFGIFITWAPLLYHIYKLRFSEEVLKRQSDLLAELTKPNGEPGFHVLTHDTILSKTEYWLPLVYLRMKRRLRPSVLYCLVWACGGAFALGSLFLVRTSATIVLDCLIIWLGFVIRESFTKNEAILERWHQIVALLPEAKTLHEIRQHRMRTLRKISNRTLPAVIAYAFWLLLLMIVFLLLSKTGQTAAN